MTGIVADVMTRSASDMRLLTDAEIDYVAGGKQGGAHGSAVSSVLANALASGVSSTVELITRAVAFKIGNVSIAIGYGFGIAISVGGTSIVSIGATASA